MTRPLATLVVRLWRTSPPDVHFQATHVQTGDIRYFSTLEGVVQHLERLRTELTLQPIEFPFARSVERKRRT